MLYATCVQEPRKEIERGREEERRRVEAGSGAGKVNGGNGTTKNRSESMGKAVEKQDACKKPGQGAKPAGIAVGNGSEQEADSDGANQAEEPFAVFEWGHGKPGNFSAGRANRGVVHGKKPGESFVGDVGGERETQEKPGVTEITRVGKAGHVRILLEIA